MMKERKHRRRERKGTEKRLLGIYKHQRKEDLNWNFGYWPFCFGLIVCTTHHGHQHGTVQARTG